MDKWIYICKKRYYYYETYRTYNEAWNIAKYYKRRNRTKFYIMPVDSFWFGDKKYRLYMTKIMRLY